MQNFCLSLPIVSPRSFLCSILFCSQSNPIFYTSITFHFLRFSSDLISTHEFLHDLVIILSASTSCSSLLAGDSPDRSNAFHENCSVFFLFLCLVNNTSLYLDHFFLHLGNSYFSCKSTYCIPFGFWKVFPMLNMNQVCYG